MLASYNELKNRAMKLDEASNNLEIEDANKYIALRQEFMKVSRQVKKIEKATYVMLLYTNTSGTFVMYEYDHFMRNKDTIMKELREEAGTDQIFSCHGSLKEYRRYSQFARK